MHCTKLQYSYISPQQAEPQTELLQLLMVTVNYCLRQTSAWLSVWNTSNFRSTIYTVFVSPGNDPFAGSPTKTLLRLLLLLNEQVWASSRAMCSCRNSQHRPVRRPH